MLNLIDTIFATIKNRVVIPPMTEGSSLEDGSVSRDELYYFDTHTGGVGMFIAPVANVSEDGKGFEGELSITDDCFLPGLTNMAKAIKKDGTKAILQIFHAGRMSSKAILRGTQTVSASAVAAPRPHAETPRELTTEEVEQIIVDFGEATRRAIQAGFDGVELHGANTYLMQQFFSPHSNKRTDKFGGDVKGRMTFDLEIIKSVKKAIDEYATEPFILDYRISPEEIEEPCIRLEDTLQFVDVLADSGIDYLHISMGSAWRTSLNNREDKTPIVLHIKETVNGRVPLISVGSIETPAQAEEVMDAGIEFVALGRESIREPQWVQKVEAGQEDTIRYTLDKNDMEELGINPAFANFLGMLGTDMHFVGEEDKDNFGEELGSIEGDY